MNINAKLIINLIILIILIVVIIIFGLILYKIQLNNKIIMRMSVSVNKRLSTLHNLYTIILDSADHVGVKLFITYGTLLGYIRENKIICYDYDLDFGISKSDFDILIPYLINKFKNSNIYKIKIKFNKIVVITHLSTKINADIFVFASNNKYCWRKIVFPLYQKYVMKECMTKYPIDWLYPLKKVQFLNKNVYIPNKPHEFLKCYYSSNYMIPNHICDKNCNNCVKK